MNSDLDGAKAPWHLWVVGLLSLLWNIGGVSDYVQVKFRVGSYLQQGADMAGVTVDEVVAYQEAFPIWANISWPLAVWGAVAGSILLLLRNRFALHAFAVSLVGLVVTSIHTISSPMPMGDPAIAQTAQTLLLIFSAAIWIVTLLLIYYAHRMTKSGVLK